MKWPLHERYAYPDAFPGNKKKEQGSQQTKKRGEEWDLFVFSKCVNSKWVNLRVFIYDIP
jgi:hypothetical protein